VKVSEWRFEDHS